MPPVTFPVFKGALYKTAITPETNFFASNLIPSDTPTTFLIYYVPENISQGGGVMNPRMKRTNGTNTIIETLWANLPAQVGVPIVVQTIVGPGDSINFEFSTFDRDIDLRTFIVIEIATTSGTLFQDNSM